MDTRKPADVQVAPSAHLTRGFVLELEGLRAIAILTVMTHRFWPASGPLAAHARVAELGWMGVDLFFVISGFLIAGILFDTRDAPGYFKNFYARRALRIFPLYYLFVGAALVVFPLVEGKPYFETDYLRAAGSPLYYLFYLGNVPEMIGHDVPSFLAPVWSLAIEEQFYLVFPLLVFLLSRRAIVALLVLAVLLAPVFRLGAWMTWPDNERIQYLATPSRFDEIALGALLAAGLRGLPFEVTRKHANLALSGCAVLFALALAGSALDRTTIVGRIGGYSVAAFTCASVVLWAVTHRGSPSAAPLRFAPVMFVGKLCYGLYLLHRPAGFLVDRALERWPVLAADAAATVPLKIALAIGLASLSFYFFERPILRFKDRFASSASPLERRPEPPRVEAGAPVSAPPAIDAAGVGSAGAR